MAGETVKSEAICLSIVPWSKTSHIVGWLTPNGKVATVAKGAVRPKSYLLGQYDLNYTCEILYYARAKGDLHALRDCVPVNLRENLRGDYRALALAGYFRRLVADFAPQGPDCREWYGLLAEALDRGGATLADLIDFELKSLELLGLEPGLEAESGALNLRGERRIPVSPEVAAYLRDPRADVKNLQIPLDAARVIGVFYQFHADCPSDIRRAVLGLIS